MKNNLKEISAKLTKYGQYGCSDHNCCLVKVTGMGTNGGCKCLPATGKVDVYKCIAAIELSKLATREIPNLIEEITWLRNILGLNK